MQANESARLGSNTSPQPKTHGPTPAPTFPILIIFDAMKCTATAASRTPAGTSTRAAGSVRGEGCAAFTLALMESVEASAGRYTVRVGIGIIGLIRIEMMKSADEIRSKLSEARSRLYRRLRY